MTDNEQTRPTIKGKVELIKEPWTNTAGTYTKREIVVDTGYRFPNPVMVTFKNNAISRLDGVTVGDMVEIPFAIDGRKWQSPDGAVKYFTEVVGLGLEVKHAAEPPQAVTEATWADVREAWQNRHGNDKQGLVKLCKELKPGMASKDYSGADCADVLNAITGATAATPDAAEDLDDLPF